MSNLAISERAIAADQPILRPRMGIAWPARKSIYRAGGALLLLAAIVAGAVWFFVPPAVETVRPVRGEAIQAVYATGTVEPTVMTPIAPRLGARLRTLAVDEGAKIKSGQVLATLEDDDVKNALKQLEAQAAFARQDYQRYAALARQGAIARQTFERAKTQWDAAQAAVAQSRAQAGYMTLIAPADGTVIRRDGEIGQFIPAGQAIFWLSRNAPLRISADVDEEDIPKVKVGEDVLVRADALPGKILHGRVMEITPKGDPVARSYRVRVAVPADSPLMIGMTAEVNIVTYRKQNALLVPASSVRDNELWVISDGKLHRLQTQIGVRGTQAVEILGGVDDNAAVVRSPSSDAREGSGARPATRRWAP